MAAEEGRGSITAFFGAWRHGFERAVRVAVRSASRTARRGTIVIQTYRGYGTAKRIYLTGRVMREASPEIPAGHGLWHNLRIIWRLMRAWGIDNAEIKAVFADNEITLRTDRDGYFHLDLALDKPPPADRLWHQVALHLNEPVAIDVEGDIFIPRANAGCVVISDIDDTVMHTGVANKLMMMWRLFVQGAESRTAIPGMASFLRALYHGPDRDGANPMLYVSRAPWAIYGVLDRFFNLHEIPAGPILFLREWGLTLQHPLPRRGKGHKLDLIRQIIEHYDTLPFVLIGDSGQRDPEVYAEIVRRFPKRVLAVYIRDVSGDPKRDQAIRRLASELADSGSQLVLASDILAMANHAREHGLIADAAIEDIDAELQASAEAA